MRVRYAVKFTLRDKLRLRGPGRPRHGRRKASDTRRGFFRVVQPAGAEGAVGGLRAGARLHDRAAIRVGAVGDRKSTRLNSSHVEISYAVFCLKKKTHRTD